MAHLIGPGLQPEHPAQPVAQNDREAGDRQLFPTREEGSVNIFIHQPQPVKNGERAQRGLEKGLSAGGQWLAPGQTEERASQNAKSVEESSNHGGGLCRDWAAKQTKKRENEAQRVPVAQPSCLWGLPGWLSGQFPNGTPGLESPAGWKACPTPWIQRAGKVFPFTAGLRFPAPYFCPPHKKLLKIVCPVSLRAGISR